MVKIEEMLHFKTASMDLDYMAKGLENPLKSLAEGSGHQVLG
jgi:hypothetical protein